MVKRYTVNKYEIFLYLVQSSHQCKTTALSSNDSVTPHFYFIYDFFDTHAPITEIVYTAVKMEFEGYLGGGEPLSLFLLNYKNFCCDCKNNWSFICMIFVG